MTEKSIPFVTAAQMREVDRLMVEVYGIQLIQMMENAGRHLAELAVDRYLGKDPLQNRVIVLVGSGGNGGGALVCARNLLNWGFQVEVILSQQPSAYEDTIHQQIRILEAYSVPLRTADQLEDAGQADLIVDGIIGYSLQGAPHGSAAKMIHWTNSSQSEVLALDIPSGLDATTGEILSPAVKADATLTLALPKTGLELGDPGIIGDLFLADIGVPPALYAQPSLNLHVGPLFRQKQIIRLTP
jgi:NAD(P)H-hydrate epimerase